MSTILYVNPTAIHGGAEEALVGIMSCGQELGYSPVLITPGEGWLTERARSMHATVELLPSLPDTMVVDSWRQQFRPWVPNAYAIAQLARKHKAALVHSNTPRSSYHGGLGGRLAGIPTITHVHDIVSLPYASPKKARLLSSLADWTLTPSNAVERAVVEYAPMLQSRIQTIYYGWEPDVYAGVEPAALHELFGVPNGVTVLGCVAAMTPWKGQDTLIDAFAIVHARHPQTHLLLIGSSQGNIVQDVWERQLHQRVTDRALTDAVTFTGWREDVWAIMRSLDVLAHVPTKPDPLPTALLHACALGIPSVVSSTGGIPEMIEDQITGLLVPPGDAEALSNALTELIMSPALRERYAHATAERFRQKFNRRQMRDGLAAAYERCLSRKKAAS